jgi:mono/diheme cytochrome c family protein
VKPLAFAIAVLVAAAGAARAESPALDYMLQCQGCHRADGGATPGSVPPLAGLVARFLDVPGGREYLVRVPGSSQSPLGDAELAELLNWIVHRFGPAQAAADSAPFTAEEVARVRRPPLTHVGDVRRALLEQMETGPPMEDRSKVVGRERRNPRSRIRTSP